MVEASNSNPFFCSISNSDVLIKYVVSYIIFITVFYYQRIILLQIILFIPDYLGRFKTISARPILVLLFVGCKICVCNAKNGSNNGKYLCINQQITEIIFQRYIATSPRHEIIRFYVLMTEQPVLYMNII
jgi:hypothetical protein